MPRGVAEGVELMTQSKARQWVLLQRPRRRGSSAFLRRMEVKEGELEELRKSAKSVS
jgi:hypothetical protein